MPEINVGDKIPGTYCPLCGEMGLRKMIFKGTTWAVCPMLNGEPVVKKLKDAHTAYVISTKEVEEPETFLFDDPIEELSDED